MIDLAVAGDPAGCRSRARSLSALVESLDDVIRLVDDGARDSEAEWTGLAATSFRSASEPLAREVTDLNQRVGWVGAALATFADELDGVRTAMSRIHAGAQAAGLRTTPDQIHQPATVDADAAGVALPHQFGTPGSVDLTPRRAGPQRSPQEVAALTALHAAYNRAVTDSQAARDREDAAHESLQEALARADADGWFVEALRAAGLLPPDHSDVARGGAWLLDKTFAVLEPSLPLIGPLGISRFAPKGLDGLYVAQAGKGLLDRLDVRNWSADATKAEARAGWLKAARVVRGAGAFFSGALTAWDQWQHDADNPAMSTEERSLRSVGRGLATAGAIALAGAGTVALAAVLVPAAPVVAVGAAVVGVGIGVGYLADEISDGLLNEWDEDRSALENVGDALTFWD